MGLDPRKEIDHVNRRGYDCRRKNLREAPGTTNRWNTPLRCDNKSGVKGVGWHKHQRKWYVRIRVRGKSLSLGYFAKLTDARDARMAAVRKYHGAFAGEER